jgi:phosphoribosylamine-glycine ligase
LDEAINKSRDLIEAIEFEEKYFRRDIGFEFLPPLPEGEAEEQP